MSDESLSREERSTLLRRMIEDEDRMRGPDGVRGEEYHRTHERYYTAMGEYYDRLPRIPMSVCPYCGAEFKHSFDPYGLDGPWWESSRLCAVTEPATCPHFQVLLGAFSLHGREPDEVRRNVLPGPEVPFVIPKLLEELPGMIAVVSEIGLETGDAAWPIAYFSDSDEIDPAWLHQEWLRQDFWFDLPNGESGWSIANDPWDTDLRPWLERGLLRWIDLSDPDLRVRRLEEGLTCPYEGIEGDPRPQALAWGRRDLLPPPDGRILSPFDDGDAEVGDEEE